ncbi:DNA primase [Halalkaliarchaeum desulfuricum]|uniref:DNA primase DnaG n=1 Tax=Halalkaliarchaeum desulfuricum TaxID=2055893 RepID=A0A343TP39_9EURY|nr:DNA primase DnaG [Halalkaliarchaeum desulfuricum]AUX10861.1 DNA primase [Halalkaliarchaeum desulfuricum]
MNDTAKYLIHATIAADGVVERSDVVGAVFGQTEGLLGEELDLRELQQASKVGRIDVQIESENGQSFGEVTIASSLNKAETAILAASLETITRVGPCHAHIEVTDIEDVRAAKRRAVVDRAKELLAEGFDESIITSEEILAEVRESARIDDIDEYEGLPAGPRVHDSDAVIVVEGRADVGRLLQCGIKNAIAVEGTNVPDVIADLTEERTVTAFLDGDRGGELILQELAQIGSVDYVTFAPAGRSVEELDRTEVMDALRAKVPYAQIADEPNARLSLQGDGTDPLSGSRVPTDPAAPEPTDEGETDEETDEAVETAEFDVETVDEVAPAVEPDPAEPDVTELDVETPEEGEEPVADGEEPVADGEPETTEAAPTESDEEVSEDGPRTLRSHVEEVIAESTGLARLLDAEFELLEEIDGDDAFDAVERRETAPHAMVVDGEATQRLLDVAAQRGVDQLVARSAGDYVKKPIGTRVLTADQLLVEA